MRRFLFKLLLSWFKRQDLTLEERNLFTGVVLDRLEALPLHDIITATDEGLFINGQLLDIENARTLRDAALAATRNKALNLVAEQVLWIAVQRGLHNGDTPEKLHFYRAAIWFGAQLQEHLQILAQQGQQLSLE